MCRERLMFLALLALAGCGDHDTDAVTCIDDAGNAYAVGEGYDVSDCGNTCNCQPDGTWSCTDLGCVP